MTDVPSSDEGESRPRNHFDAMASYIARATTGERAALARLHPEALRPHELGALARALASSDLIPDRWEPAVWSRWALIAHGMALAGHDRRRALGQQLAAAGVSESRVTKLLTARGDAFRQLLPRILRLLASRSVSPNWTELGEIVLREGSSSQHAQHLVEGVRLRVAGAYFAEQARSAKA